MHHNRSITVKFLRFITQQNIQDYVTSELGRVRKPRGVADNLILILTGIRISELLSLKLQNLKFEVGYMFVKGKGGHTCEIPIGLYLMVILITYPRYDETDLVFPGMREQGN